MIRRRWAGALAGALLFVLPAVGGCSPQSQQGGADGGDEARSARREAISRFWRDLSEATTLRLAGDCEQAARLYRDALEHDPSHEDSLYYLGQCQLELGRVGPARDAFSRLLEVNASSVRGQVALGAILASPASGALYDPEAAEAHFRRAHEINGEETGPILRLGEILIARGRPQEALEWLEAAFSTNPRSYEAAFMAGYLHWEAGDLDQARDALRRALEARGGDAPIQGVLGEGDRKPGKEAHGRSMMGETLFGSFCENLDAAMVSRPEIAYQPVREFVNELRRR